MYSKCNDIWAHGNTVMGSDSVEVQRSANMHHTIAIEGEAGI